MKIIPLVGDPHPHPEFPVTVKSPKSCAFPSDAIVTKSIILVLSPPKKAALV